MGAIASQITKLRLKSKKTSELRVTGLCAGNSPGPVNSPHKRPVTRKIFPFYDVILSLDISPQPLYDHMLVECSWCCYINCLIDFKNGKQNTLIKMSNNHRLGVIYVKDMSLFTMETHVEWHATHAFVLPYSISYHILKCYLLLKERLYENVWCIVFNHQCLK